MQINTTLILILGLREKEAYKLCETWSILLQCSSKCIQAWVFVQVIFFPGNFIDFCFMVFTKVLMKDLARMLIHVRKTYC